MNNFQNFNSLHQQACPLLIGNVWDVKSALLYQELGYQALGTSSAAVAESLGYQDGEELSFDELLSVVKLIKKQTCLPLSVDIEGGYSRQPEQILDHIVSLAKLGVVGINLEDSVVENGERRLLNPERFSQTVDYICKGLKEIGIQMFLNIRTDPFLLAHEGALSDTLTRAKIYEGAGANGLFVPCVTKSSDIDAIVQATNIPVNVMAMPDLPDLSTLQSLGVKRVSTGNFLYQNMQQFLTLNINSMKHSQSFDRLFVNS